MADTSANGDATAVLNAISTPTCSSGVTAQNNINTGADKSNVRRSVDDIDDGNGSQDEPSTATRSLQCHNCAFHCDDVRALREHNDYEHSDVFIIACDHCSETFRSHEDLYTHTEHRHTFQCQKCDYCCNDIDTLAVHEDDEHTPVIWNCEKCSFIGGDYNALMEHQDTQHPPPGRCDVCGKKYSTIRNRNRHIEFAHPRQ